MKNIAIVLTALALLAIVPAQADETNNFLVGGPLAGVELPEWQGQHGEEPGYPGTLAGQSKPEQQPEYELYPGSVEHWRCDNYKYLPFRSFFDRQSQIKNWVADPKGDPEHGYAALPGSYKIERYAEPVYQVTRYKATNTGKARKPVHVIRCSPGSPAFKLDLGELRPGMYVVRVIAAVETEKLRSWREPIFVGMAVNDGITGEVNRYRIRIGYNDQFYSVAQLYFHAPEKRAYQAEVYVDQGSTVDLLVHNISLDDVLAGTTRRALKTGRTFYTERELSALKTKANPEKMNRLLARWKPYTTEERLARDEAIWQWVPPLNMQGLGMMLSDQYRKPGNSFGTTDKTREEIQQAFGKWEMQVENTWDHLYGGTLRRDQKFWNALLVNRKLNLTYSNSDLWAGRPLPDPYPYKADGAGLYFPDPDDTDKGRMWAPIASAVSRRLLRSSWAAIPDFWIQSGNDDFARDAAVNLIAFAYRYPSHEGASNYLVSVVQDRAYLKYDLALRNRMLSNYWARAGSLDAVKAYDKLYPYIKGNEALAESISRFIPWVENAEDLIELLDVYLVQTTAKRIMRFNDYRAQLPQVIVDVAVVQGDASATDPWMQWAFTRSAQPPLPREGMKNSMIVRADRTGSDYIGSTTYADGKSATKSAIALEKYLATGGSARYDLSNPRLYPKPLAHCYFQFERLVGGVYDARAGDVAGPGMRPHQQMQVNKESAENSFADKMRAGWRWSRDPKFAWVLKHYVGRKAETDVEWADIEAAAARQKRAPWLDNRSRFLPNWFGALESGTTHDDYRLRHSVYVRTGIGDGHAHADALDLQVVAHGLHMTVDGGQRSGYSKPNDRFTRIHNTVEVDGGRGLPNAYGHLAPGWVNTLSDVEGARYMKVSAVIGTPTIQRTDLYQRQVMLIDTAHAMKPVTLPAAQQLPSAKMPALAEPANSYVVDIFRVSGGKEHAYNFHAMIEDEAVWNVANEQKVTTGPEDEFLREFRYEGAEDFKFAGDIQGVLEATFRHRREAHVSGCSEQQLLSKNFDPASPRKYTRWHILGAQGMRALRARVNMHKAGYQWTSMSVRTPAETNKQSAFVALIEPYVGKPFIAERQLVNISANESDARKAVALEVTTTNGHQDLIFADGRPDRQRSFTASAGNVAVAAEFAFVSHDKDGLRLATLTGGTLLDVPGLRIETTQREHHGKIIAVDYLSKKVTVDTNWRGAHAHRPLEIGVSNRMTTYTPVAIETGKNSSVFTMQRGADFYSSRITDVIPDEKQVNCAMTFRVRQQFPGYDDNWVATNEAMTRTWRADRRNGNQFILKGGPVNNDDFGYEKVLRLWEYGVGDAVRQSTFVSVRRIKPGTWLITGDVHVKITMDGKTFEVTAQEMQEGGRTINVP